MNLKLKPKLGDEVTRHGFLWLPRSINLEVPDDGSYEYSRYGGRFDNRWLSWEAWIERYTHNPEELPQYAFRPIKWLELNSKQLTLLKIRTSLVFIALILVIWFIVYR